MQRSPRGCAGTRRVPFGHSDYWSKGVLVKSSNSLGTARKSGARGTLATMAGKSFFPGRCESDGMNFEMSAIAEWAFSQYLASSLSSGRSQFAARPNAWLWPSLAAARLFCKPTNHRLHERSSTSVNSVLRIILICDMGSGESGFCCHTGRPHFRRRDPSGRCPRSRGEGSR